MIAKRRIYSKFTAKPGDWTFMPDLEQDPVNPEGEDATRFVRLWEWAEATFDENDSRIFMGDGQTAYRRWLNLESVYYAHEDDTLDLPGDAPVGILRQEGLI